MVFVALGRASHDESAAFAGFLRVWWPFAVGLGIGGLVSGAWRHPYAWRRVAAMLAVTVAVGMLLRIAVQGRDLEPSFVIVTTVFLGLCDFGWRLVARAATRRRAAAARR